jgi:HSP20 family protein
MEFKTETQRSYHAPCTCFYYDQKEGRYSVEVQLPGVDKKDIALDMWDDNFCVYAKKDDSEYSGCYMFSHYIDPGKAEARYENGLLKIYAPFKDWDQRTHVSIH